jgi:hypothetical protein
LQNPCAARSTNSIKRLLQTLKRLQDVEGQISRQAKAVDDMSDQAKAGANHMIVGMEREREELMRISRDLTSQAQTIGDSIGKHTSSISEAARVAEAEVRAADQALDHRLTSFGAAAALISDRTNGLSSAAQASADSALRLEQALSTALDVLSKATNLTDAARQSAEAATYAANSTAGAVRETTHRAIDDAKRAAELIRGEAVNVEREAAIALERLRDAANAARVAARGARDAVGDDETAPGYDRSWRDEAQDPLELPPARNRNDPPPPMFGDAAPEQQRARAPAADKPVPGDWTWRDLLSNVDGPEQGAPPAAARREPAADPVAHLRRQIAEPRTATLPIVETIEHAGLRLDEVFSPSALERIAQRARSGTQARRRAVRDAAPEAARTHGRFPPPRSASQSRSDAIPAQRRRPHRRTNRPRPRPNERRTHPRLPAHRRRRGLTRSARFQARKNVLKRYRAPRWQVGARASGPHALSTDERANLNKLTNVLKPMRAGRPALQLFENAASPWLPGPRSARPVMMTNGMCG